MILYQTCSFLEVLDITALFLTSICPQWRAQHSEFWGSETCITFYC